MLTILYPFLTSMFPHSLPADYPKCCSLWSSCAGESAWRTTLCRSAFPWYGALSIISPPSRKTKKRPGIYSKSIYSVSLLAFAIKVKYSVLFKHKHQRRNSQISWCHTSAKNDWNGRLHHLLCILTSIGNTVYALSPRFVYSGLCNPLLGQVLCLWWR